MATIYKIEFNEYIYIGSTIQKLYNRRRYHNYALRQNKDIHHKSRLYTTARENGINRFELTEIEQCNIDERLNREQYYIDLNKGDKLLNCYNTYGGDKTEYNRKYGQENKDKINKRRRELKALKRQAENNDD